MNLKTITLALAMLMLFARLVVGRYNQADSKLNSFFESMVKTELPAARQSIDESIRLWPWNSRYYAWRAYLLSQQLPTRCPHVVHGAILTVDKEDQQVVQKALTDYNRALEFDKQDAVAYHNKAWLEHLLGNNDAAARDWSKATLIDPLNSAFHLSYGMFLEETGQSELGKDQIEAAIWISPSILDSPFFDEYRSLSSNMAQAVVDRCISKMEAKLLTGRDAILEARLAKLYQSSGNFTRSLELLQDAVEKLPNLALAWLNLGEVYASRGDIQHAIDCYKKANVMDKSLASPYLRMGEIYLKAGQKETAAQFFRDASDQSKRVTLITASQNNRLYSGPHQKINDLLPPTLVRYITPCEVPKADSELENLAGPSEGLRYQTSRTCGQVPSPHFWP